MNLLRIIKSLVLVVLTACLSGLLPAEAEAWQPNWKACFKHSGGFSVPYTGTVDPVIDGEVSSDLGWTRAWRYVFNNGTPVYDVAVQVTQSKNAQQLFFSFEVNNDSALNATDTIVVAFDTGVGANSKKLLEIKPLINGGVRMGPDPDNPAGAQIPTPQINYYAAANPPFGSSSMLPASTRARTTSSGSGSNWSWRVELQLNKADFGIPAAGTFGLYFNTLVTQGTGTGPTSVLNEYAWPVPANSGEYLYGSPTEPPAVSRWGTATSDASIACNGVSIESWDIGSTNNPPTKLLLGQQNTIQAVVHNNSIDAAGNPKSAKQITAKFKYATFGMSQVWNDIPADPGSTNPSVPVDILNSSTLQTKWTVPLNNPNFPDGGKTCILAELNTTAPSAGPNDWTTVFVNKSAWNNFHYSTASRVDAAPVIDSRGWAKRSARANHQVELFVMSQVDRIEPELARTSLKSDVTAINRINPALAKVGLKADLAATPNVAVIPKVGLSTIKQIEPRLLDPRKALSRMTHFPVEKNASFTEYAARLLDKNVNVSQMVYSVHGCRRTGKFVNINKAKIEVCERVGSYGFGMRHAGLGEIDWLSELQGAEYVDGSKDHLRISIKPNAKVTLKTKFTANDRLK
ncbi:MAG: hypothetical protein PHI31_02240 [Desulfuromonadaceae bacterium]|nr:hypothetical protein [Desulfuromonadaceae bacterium]